MTIERIIVRPLDDVIRDCNTIMIPKLPGDRMIAATWAALCEGSRLWKEARATFDDPDMQGPGTLFHRHNQAGQSYAAATIVRKIADALGVPNTVED